MKINRNYLKILALFTLIFTIYMVYGRVTAEQVQPGSDKDPIVTKSYVESQIAPLKDSISRLSAASDVQVDSSTLSQLSDKVNDLSIKTKFLIDTNNDLVKKVKDLAARLDAVKDGSFKLNAVPSNKMIYLGEGAQIILRVGKMVAFSNGDSGFSDVTVGADTTNGQSVARDHLLVCPKADTRHFKTLAQSYLLISGKYQIK